MRKLQAWVIPLAFILTLISVEIIIVQGLAVIGLLLHALLILLALLLATFNEETAQKHPMYGLLLIPLARLVSFSLPTLPLPDAVLHLAYVLCMIIASGTVYYVLSHRPARQLPHPPPVHLIVAASGLLFGAIGYLILLPPVFVDVNLNSLPPLTAAVLVLIAVSGIIDGVILYSILLPALTALVRDSVALLLLGGLYAALQFSVQSPLYTLLILVQVLFLGGLSRRLASSRAAVLAHGMATGCTFALFPVVLVAG